MIKQNIKGFTHIEVLVVVLIIGILTSIALPQYQKSVMKSRYSTLMQMVESITEAEEVYFSTYNKYTDNFEELDIQPSGCSLSGDKKTCVFAWGTCALNTAADDAVSCVNNTTLKNGYAHYLTEGKYKGWKRMCWSLSGNEQDQYSKLCELIGGTKRLGFDKVSCPPFGMCAVYSLDEWT